MKRKHLLNHNKVGISSIFPDFKGKGNPMYRYPVILAVLIGAYLLWQRPSGWPFVGMFTYFIAGIINAVYCLLFVKEEGN
jgi:CDP-diacylglycerol--serine O-phosphatidyltransferase